MRAHSCAWGRLAESGPRRLTYGEAISISKHVDPKIIPKRCRVALIVLLDYQMIKAINNPLLSNQRNNV